MRKEHIENIEFNIDGFYINLEHRKDRKEHIENNIKSKVLFKNIERFDAIKNNIGALGCAESHLECLKNMKKYEKDYFILLEDDFMILNEENFQKFSSELKVIIDSELWDIILLTPRGNTAKKNFIGNFNKITDSQTTTGYIIKKKFIDILIKNLEESIENLKKNKNHDIYAYDQYWKKLQINYNFIYYNKIFAGQIPGFSDIERRKTNYNKRFLEQIRY